MLKHTSVWCRGQRNQEAKKCYFSFAAGVGFFRQVRGHVRGDELAEEAAEQPRPLRGVQPHVPLEQSHLLLLSSHQCYRQAVNHQRKVANFSSKIVCQIFLAVFLIIFVEYKMLGTFLQKPALSQKTLVPENFFRI